MTMSKWKTTQVIITNYQSTAFLLVKLETINFQTPSIKNHSHSKFDKLNEH